MVKIIDNFLSENVFRQVQQNLMSDGFHWDFKDGKARYELNDDHNHLIDIKTGNIIEFTSDEIESIQKKIAEKHGYKLVDSKLELYCVKDKSD